MAARTFLEAVNATLKETRIIAGSAGELTTFTDSARQADIDLMLKSWNDVLRFMRRFGIFTGETAESTITLATGVDGYSLASDYERMVGNPIDGTNKQELWPYPGGFLQLRSDRKDRSDYKGLPRNWVINPTSGELEIDTQPTSSEDGRVYTYVYEKTIELTLITDTFPFSNETVDALQDAVVQTFQRKTMGQFDKGVFNLSLSTAVHFAKQKQSPDRWGARTVYSGSTDAWYE